MPPMPTSAAPVSHAHAATRARSRPPRAELRTSILRRTIGPALLLATTPLLAIVLWMIGAHHDGSIVAFARAIDTSTFLRLLPRPTLPAVGVVAGWIALQALLLRALPGPTHRGPVTPAGERPAYRLNGVAAWIVTHALLVGGWALDLFSASAIVDRLGSILVVLNLFALALCAALYAKGLRHPSSRDVVYTGHFLFDFFQGLELHPRVGGVSLKQLFNCRVSMMGWSALVLCLAGAQFEREGRLSSGALVSTALLVLYLLKFFVWESGYFASLDVMHDRFGYYIAWGVLVWVPAVYTLPWQYLSSHPSDLHPTAALALFALGVAALYANYAADAQRQRVRATGGATTVWGRVPETIPARYRTADGEERENLLLASGYWGLARHFHYVPELVLAACWTIPAGLTHLLPWLYFVFLAILLVDRAGRDDARCAAKYGEAWDEYRRRVPSKIVPGLY